MEVGFSVLGGRLILLQPSIVVECFTVEGGASEYPEVDIVGGDRV